MDIAKKAGKTPAQVCLRWNLDKGWVVEKQLSGMAPELQGKSLRIKRAVHRSSRLIE